ncbi:helix-turn-helix domain-containing protein [Saccharopolyspora cebuensis]|uniref:helix-turn-helix domain-containing protein n=1 Tax=Saccharopolyspora cebuensis TaxID=418759 RepID=UPI0031ECB36D
MRSHARRVCRTCGKGLAADNTASLCSACQRRDAATVPETKPDVFWRRPALAEALKTRHFGAVLYAYRYEHRPVLTQAVVARWLGLTQAQVSRIERAPRPPADLDKLAAWAEVLHIPENFLWFRLPDRRTARDRGSGAAFGWFSGPPPVLTAASATPVDVTSIRQHTTMFRRFDNRFGGGHARSAVSTYLSAEVAPALTGWRTANPEFAGAVAELNQLAGWMAYDVGDALSGRRHLQHALHMCQHAGDAALGAEMLAGMSHQAAHAGNGATALALATAARDTAKRTPFAALESETAAMAAHGHALVRDKPAALRALHDADAAFARAAGQAHPEWLSYYDAAYLAAKSAHCLLQLGDHRQAEQFARRSLRMSAGYDRSRLFNTALLASVLAARGAVDEACAVGREAVRLAGAVQSARGREYLRDVARRLRRYRCAPAVAEFVADLAQLGVTAGPRGA